MTPDIGIHRKRPCIDVKDIFFSILSLLLEEHDDKSKTSISLLFQYYTSMSHEKKSSNSTEQQMMRCEAEHLNLSTEWSRHTAAMTEFDRRRNQYDQLQTYYKTAPAMHTFLLVRKASPIFSLSGCTVSAAKHTCVCCWNSVYGLANARIFWA